MIQLRVQDLSDLVFMDIETVRLQKELDKGSADYEAWEYMIKKQLRSGEIESVEQDYIDRSSLYAEFSKIVCISVGRIRDEKLTITTYKNQNEKELIGAFMQDLNDVLTHRPDTKLVGHGVKSFDIPFIMKRAISNGIVPNGLIDIAGLKPWEVTALDTKEMWKGTNPYNTSLVALCLALGLPSPKSDIEGSQVGDVYYKEGKKGIERIAKYCERDTMAVANVVKKFRFEDVFDTYEASEPKPPRELGLMERIAKVGKVSEKDQAIILDQATGKSIDEKEKIIKILKASLLVTENLLDEDLELKILSA